MWVRTCEACEALWRSYEEALAEHMAAMDLQRRAMLCGGDSDEHEMKLDYAHRRRADARKRIREHVWTSHSARLSEEEDQMGMSGRVGTILIIHPKRATRNLIRAGLMAAGYHVAEAADGMAAILMVERISGFSLLITELRLPDMNGLTLARRLLAVRRDAHGILCSDECDDFVALRSDFQSRLAFVGRPCRARSVIEAAKSMLAERKAA